ncbi:MAG TPA: acyl-CoA dehydrogenase family protein, partial [Ktedonobacterales bacterium]|nr:acyl-CoA dehydrogenase family protein [Ktedonobacterales bacterium]
MVDTVSERKGRHAAQQHVALPPATDLYNISSLLSEDERMVRDTVREFVRERVLPTIGEHFEAGTFPRELIPEIAQLGLLGMHLEGYECAGMSAVQYGLACQELEFGDSGLRSFVSVQGSLAMFPIWAYGSEEQKQKYLPKMASGELRAAFSLSEPELGSDVQAIKTSAKKLDDGAYEINGQKMWVTNGLMSSLVFVLVKTDPDAEPRHKGFTCFIAEQ